MNEIELKFIIDEPTATEVWKRVRNRGIGRGRAVTRTLRSIYYDTPQQSLRKAGIALRLRRDGRRWIQTVKSKARLYGGLSAVGEWESPAPGGRLRLDAIGDTAIRDEVRKLVDGAVLAPVCETVMKRKAAEVCAEDGTTAVLATDFGEIRADGRAETLREAEIELVDGRVEGLFDIAHELFPEGGLTFSRLSKAARGYLLAEKGRIDEPLAPRNAVTVRLHRKQTVELAARDIFRECADQIAQNINVIEKLDDPEGPHQLRIGLRRLRSAFAVFGPLLKSPELSRLSDEARWIGREVGRLRDIDVVIEDIVLREAGVHPGEPGFAHLAEALHQEAAGIRDTLRTLLVGPRVQAFLIDLVRFVETRGWLVADDYTQTERLARPVPKLAAAALDKRWKKTRRRARHLRTLTIDERHALRKELKKLRYAAEFFAPLFSEKRARRFRSRMKNLQTVFGDLNDAAMVKAMFAQSQTGLADGAGTKRAVGWVIGASAARADTGWYRAKALWRDLERTRPFWR